MCNTIVYMLERTQVMLDKDTKKEMQEIAESRGLSLSLFLRKLISESMRKERKKHKKDGVAVLDKMAKSAVDGPGNQEYDKYAYDL